MKKKKQNQNQYKTILIIIGILAVLTIILFLIPKSNNAEEELVEEGYETSEEDAFYKKIVSGNTLDDFYSDIANNRSSYYEEYDFSKESKDYIELKMTYNDGLNTTLNISSDLTTKEIEYNYEVTKGKSRILLEGNSTNNYNCDVILEKNVKSETVDSYCEQVITEVNAYIIKRDEFLKNKTIQKYVNAPMNQYIEKEQ